MTRRLAALLVTQIVLGWVSPEAFAQDDKTLERVRSLDVESLPGPVPTYYSPGARPRAEALQRRVRDAVSFFESRYGIPSPLSLAILNEPHWAALSPGPYGGMSASAAPPVVLLPAFPDRGVMAQFFRATHAAASSPEVRQAWASLGVSHEMAVPQVIDAMVFHEVGHVFLRALGFSWTRHWFNEFTATYMAHILLRREPATLRMWKAVSLDIVHGFKPSTRSLDEFNRLYGMKLGPETYGWFYSQVNLGVAAVLEHTQDADWFKELRAAGLDKGNPSLTTSELLDRLERMTPGIKNWAEKLEKGP